MGWRSTPIVQLARRDLRSPADPSGTRRSRPLPGALPLGLGVAVVPRRRPARLVRYLADTQAGQERAQWCAREPVFAALVPQSLDPPPQRFGAPHAAKRLPPAGLVDLDHAVHGRPGVLGDPGRPGVLGPRGVHGGAGGFGGLGERGAQMVDRGSGEER